MRNCILILMIFSLTACNSLKVVPVHSDTKLKKDGLFYYLPKTQIIVDVTVRETRYMKGPFAQYSAKFTGISNVITENKTEYAVQNIEMSSNAVPDTSRLFYLYTKGIKNKEAFLLRLDESGCIAGLNTDELQSEKIKSGLNETPASTSGQQSESEGFGQFATSNTQIKTDTIIEKIILDTVTIEKQILQHRIIEKSIEDKAKDAADYISLISENKMNLIAGYQEVDYDLDTYNNMLGELNKMLQDYLNLFTGKSVEYTYHYRFIIEPNEINKQSFLFNFTNTEGISEYPDSLPAENIYYYRIFSEDRTQKIETALSNSRKNINKGLAYNIPEECSLVIEKGNGEVVFIENLGVCQLGITGYLPDKMKHIRFNSVNGSVLRIEK